MLIQTCVIDLILCRLLKCWEVSGVKDFPDFMKSKSNHISSKEQNTENIDGYFYEGADGSQMAFWTCYSDRVPLRSIFMSLTST